MKYHHFEILRGEDGELLVLGQGAGGKTYKARDTQLARLVALKVVTADAFRTPEARERFVAEARTAASLHHSNIASIYYFGEQDGDCFYAMEFVDGCTLEELVQRDGALPAAVALDIACQTAAALGVAHEADLIHRDVKPANILITESSPGHLGIKLIDFGLAAGANAAAGGKAVFAGTPLFASPEQLDEADVDARSDIYSLGAVLFFMISGRPPYLGTLSQIVTQHTLQPTPVDLISSAPAEVIALVKRYMKKDPDQRPRSGAQARAEAEAALSALRPDNQATALEWLTNHYGAVSRLRQVEGGLLYGLTETETGERAEALHLDRSAAGLQAADQYRFAVPKVAELGSPCLREPGALVEVADGLLVINKAAVPSTRLLSVMRVRRMLPLDEVRLILRPLAQALDEAAAAGLAIPRLGLRDIELCPAQEPQTRLNLWLELTACVDLLPIAEAANINTSATMVGSSLVTASRVVSGEGADPSAVVASLAYEMLGGMTAPSSGHYVPLAELGEAQNRAISLALSAAGAPALSATDLIELIFHSQERSDAGQSVRSSFVNSALSISRPVTAPPVSSSKRPTTLDPSGSQTGEAASAGSLTARRASLSVAREGGSPFLVPQGEDAPSRLSDKALALAVIASVLTIGTIAFAVSGVWQEPRTEASATISYTPSTTPEPASAPGTQVPTGFDSRASGTVGPIAASSIEPYIASANFESELKVSSGTPRANSNPSKASESAVLDGRAGGEVMPMRDQTGLQPGSAVGVVDLKLEDGGSQSMPLKNLRLAIKARPGQPVDASDVRINVTFYETLNGEIVPTMSRVQSSWFTAPVDWKSDGLEILEVNYEVPRIGPDGGPPPTYYGYMVNIYHRGQLQETRAEPSDLPDLFPPPREELPSMASRPMVSSPTKAVPRSAQRSLPVASSVPRYVAIEIPRAANTPRGTTPVMVYDTMEKRVVGNNVYNLEKRPQRGSVEKLGGVEAVFLGKQ